jgi:hypothetical protein
MLTERHEAAAPATAPETLHQTQSYKRLERLSNTIDLILGTLSLGLQYPHLSPSEQRTVLDYIDKLLRLKIDLKRGQGVGCGT